MIHKERKEEVREILALDTDELVKRAKGQLVLFPTLDEVYNAKGTVPLQLHIASFCRIIARL